MTFAVSKIVKPSKIWASNKVKAKRLAQHSRALDKVKTQNGLHGFLKSHRFSFYLFLRKLLGLKEVILQSRLRKPKIRK